MARIEPLRPGEEPFITDPNAAENAVRRARERGSVYSRGEPAYSHLSQPRVGASEEEEDAWAHRVHLGEARRQRKQEQQVYKAARAGQKVEVDDPVLQQVAEYGEEMHAADRRHDFLIGVGAFGRAMGTLTHFGHRGSSMLAKASKRKWG